MSDSSLCRVIYVHKKICDRLIMAINNYYNGFRVHGVICGHSQPRNKTQSYSITSIEIIIQCNQAREQNFFISEFEPILTHKIKSIIDKSLKFGTNLL